MCSARSRISTQASQGGGESQFNRNLLALTNRWARASIRWFSVWSSVRHVRASYRLDTATKPAVPSRPLSKVTVWRHPRARETWPMR